MNGYRIFIGLALTITVVGAYYIRKKLPEKFSPDNRHGRKTSLGDPLFLPILLSVSLLWPVLRDMVGPSLIIITLYYSLLVLLMPLLRRLFLPEDVSLLWFLPNFLYLGYYLSGMGEPTVFIPFPLEYLPLITHIWLGGVGLSLGWQILQHMFYRHRILKDSFEQNDESVNQMWRNSLATHDVKNDIPIVISPEVRSPVTIGLFERSMRLVLPVRQFTEDELELIFLHEANHILRDDSKNKFQIGFFTSLTWFNPFSWIARMKVSQDLELSNDVEVIGSADAKTKRLYVNLILESADCTKGYTTCLSASARGLRYRLENIIRPKKKSSGLVLIGLICFILGYNMNAFALADTAKLAETVIPEFKQAGLVIDSVWVSTWDETDSNQDIFQYDSNGLVDYLKSLTVKEVHFITKSSSPTYQGKALNLRVEGSDNSIQFISLFSDRLVIKDYTKPGYRLYFLTQELNWDYIETLLDFDAPDPSPPPEYPTLTLSQPGDPNHVFLTVEPYVQHVRFSKPDKQDRLPHIPPKPKMVGLDDYSGKKIWLAVHAPTVDGYNLYFGDSENSTQTRLI